VSKIESQTFREVKTVEADTMSYVQEQEAKSNELLLTPEYVKMQTAKLLANNTKMYFSGEGEGNVVAAALAAAFGSK